MKKFIFRNIIFFIPVLLLVLIPLSNYSLKQGDLLRVGYLKKDDAYRTVFKDDFNNTIHYDSISQTDTTRVNNCSVLIIGDSFSEQGVIGYKNYLAKNISGRLLYYDRKDITGNLFEIAYGLLNGDFFDKVNTEYVIFQYVERNFAEHTRNFDKSMILNTSRLIHDKKEKKENYSFSANSILKYPYYNLMRAVKKQGNISEVYSFKLTKPFFTGNRDKDLFIYHNDIQRLPKKNNPEHISNLNKELNELSRLFAQKEIKLVVLPAPDKYDIYYDYIIDNNEKASGFFACLNQFDKDYIYIDSYNLLKNAINKGQKDIYFADDSHWSPIGTQLIASEIADIIKL